METIGYRERLKMDDMIVYILLAVLALANLMIYRYYRMTNLSFFYLSILTLLFFILLATVLQLQVKINELGISYRFIPFHRKEKIIPWGDIEHLELVRYRPLRDYGGYGIRFNSGSKAYIIRGNRGLKIYLKSTPKPLVLSISDATKINEALSAFAPKIQVKDSLLKKI